MKRKMLLFGLGVVLAGVLGFSTPSVRVSAAAPSGAKSDICTGIGLTGGGGCGDSGAQVGSAITAAVNIMILIVGVVSVVMIIIAGLRFITSSGDASKVAGARSAIMYALIGLVVVALAETLVHFVLVKL